MGRIGRVWVVAFALGVGACSGGSDEAQAPVLPPGERAEALAVAPVISSFSPLKAVQGTLVTINGSGFVSGAAVSFNGTSAVSVTFVSSARLRAIVPPASGSGPISVTVPLGTASSTSPFLVLPKIGSVQPMRGFVGDFVTIAGSGLTATTAVKFGSVTSSFDVGSDFGITAAVPAGFTSGKITVATPAGNAVTSSNFTVLPLVTAFSPLQGPVATNVAIAGEGLSQASAVKFGTQTAVFSVISDTELHAQVPVGAASSKITVETPRGNRSSSGTFTVIKVPTVTSFTPLASELPVTLTVNGANFIAVSAVKVGSVQLPSFSVVSSKQLTAPVPLGTPSGKVSVVNAAGAGVSSKTFAAILCSDVDADSVCDRDDRCPGFDDRIDSDLDGTADGCDICPSVSSNGQSCGAGMACDGSGACVELECSRFTRGPGVFVGTAIVDDVDTAGDLAKLTDKWCITGDLDIATTQLSDLSSLAGLVEVGGSLSLGNPLPGCSPYPCTWGNDVLTSLHGLEGLRRVGDAFHLFEAEGDQGVASLEPLANLKRVTDFYIEATMALRDLHGLEGLESVRFLELYRADSLTSLAGLQNLRSAHGIRLVNAPHLQDISALSGLTSLPGNLDVRDTGLASLHGLESLTSAGFLRVAYNPNLSDLSPLSNVRSVSTLSVQGPGITSLGAFAQLETAEAIILWELGIASLHGLEGVQSAQELVLWLLPGITNLSALNNLHVSSRLFVDSLPQLIDCAGLVVSATTGVVFQENASLVSLSCLRDVSGLSSLDVRNNPVLSNLDDLHALTHVDYNVTFTGNSSLLQCEIAELEAQLGRPVDENVGNGAACEP